MLAEATKLIAEEGGSPLAAAAARVAVAVHTRGDDSRAAAANGAAPLTRAAALNATLEGLAAARDAAALPPLVADLHSPDVVVVVSQWRQPARTTTTHRHPTDQVGGTADDKPCANAAVSTNFLHTDLNGANRPICGISVLPRELCDVRSKGIAPLKPLSIAPPMAGGGGKKNNRNGSNNNDNGKKSVGGDKGVSSSSAAEAAAAAAGGLVGGGDGGGGVASSAEWRGGYRGQVAKTAKTSVEATPSAAGARTAVVNVSNEEALQLLTSRSRSESPRVSSSEAPPPPQPRPQPPPQPRRRRRLRRRRRRRRRRRLP